VKTDDIFWEHLETVPAFRALLRAMEARFYKELLPLADPVLDVGCGDGHFASVAFPQPLAAGIDPAAGTLVEARERGAHIVLARSMGEALPFGDGTFATVISNSVLEHIPDVDPVLAEIARVLKRPTSGNGQDIGRFIFCVPSEHFTEFLFFSGLFGRMGLEGLARAYEGYFNRISRHHHCIGPDEWRGHLGQAGLKLTDFFYYFSERAHHALDVGHYVGLPNLIAKRLTGRWVLIPSHRNPVLAATERWLRPLYEEPLPEVGAYLFLVAEKA
jgi:SAM-dependent methyltransferase